MLLNALLEESGGELRFSSYWKFLFTVLNLGDRSFELQRLQIG